MKQKIYDLMAFVKGNIKNYFDPFAGRWRSDQVTDPMAEIRKSAKIENTLKQNKDGQTNIQD